MTKTLIFEGLDRCLKDTLIEKIKAHVPPSHIVHYAKPPKVEDVKFYQDISFRQMFRLIDFHSMKMQNSTLILNRAHIGEFVYSPIYRDYSGEYVFDLEEKQDLSSVHLILLYDSNYEAYIKRDDGDSFNAGKIDNIKKEIESFREGFNKSKIKNKIEIDLKDYYLDEQKIDDEKILNEILNLIKD